LQNNIYGPCNAKYDNVILFLLYISYNNFSSLHTTEKLHTFSVHKPQIKKHWPYCNQRNTRKFCSDLEIVQLCN